MTSDYSQPFVDAPINIYGSTLAGSYAEPLNPPNFRTLSLPRDHRLAGKAIPWEIMVDEARGPQAQLDKFEKGYAGWSQSTADPRFRGYLINPLKTTTTTLSSGASEGNGGYFWTNYVQRMVMAKGDGANNSLTRETSNVDPTPLHVTYSPGAAICSLFSGPIGGATGTEKLFIGREGTTTDVHSTIGTSAGTMHTDFNNMWGGALSPSNAATPGTPTWIFYCGQTIKTQPVTAAIADAAASTTLTNIPGGGTVYGFESLAKSPVGNRMYMHWPNQNRTTSHWTGDGFTPTSKLRLVHINVEGTDPQEVESTLAQPQGGRFWQRNFVQFDYTRVVRYDGEQEHDLNIFSNLAASSDIKYAVIGLGGSDALLRAVVQKWDLNTAANSTLQWWEFMPQTNSWLPCSKEIAIISAATVSDGAFFLNGLSTGGVGPNLPYSKQNGASYITLNAGLAQAYAWQLVPPQGVNPFNAYRKTGSSDNASQAFENSSVHTWPAWTLPGRHAGHPFVVAEVDGRLLDLEAGGSDASSLIEIATQSGSASSALTFTNTPTKVTWKATQGIRDRVYRPPNPNALHRLQARETLTQGTGETNKTSNGLPLVIRGVTFLDDKVVPFKWAEMFE